MRTLAQGSAAGLSVGRRSLASPLDASGVHHAWELHTKRGETNVRRAAWARPCGSLPSLFVAIWPLFVRFVLPISGHRPVTIFKKASIFAHQTCKKREI